MLGHYHCGIFVIIESRLRNRLMLFICVADTQAIVSAGVSVTYIFSRAHFRWYDILFLWR